MTNATAPATDPRIAVYLARLDAAVGRLPHAEASDLVREIQVHISDKLEGRSGDSDVERVLAGLGSPEELAEHFRTELLFTRASRTFSPWLLLRTTGRWAKMGSKGLAVFMLALLGYGSGLALTVTVFLKPLLPRQVGLWVGRGAFDFGMPPNTAGRHELLGPWYIPVTAALAFAIVVGTTQALRWLIRKRIPPIARY
jgi:hypothetical protein